MACCDCCCEAVNGVCCGASGSKTCCKSPRACCNNVCCQEGEYCCGETCCPEANVCCADVCCDVDETCCNGECCADGNSCCDGVCQEEPCCEVDSDCDYCPPTGVNGYPNVTFIDDDGSVYCCEDLPVSGYPTFDTSTNDCIYSEPGSEGAIAAIAGEPGYCCDGVCSEEECPP